MVRFIGGQDGVVVLVDSHQMAAKVLKSYQSLTTPMIMLVRTAGLEPWQVPRSATKLYLLQQIRYRFIRKSIKTSNKQYYNIWKQWIDKWFCFRFLTWNLFFFSI